MKSLKQLYKNKIFWTWIFALVGFLGLSFYLLISKILLLLLVVGISALIGFTIDFISKRKRFKK